MLTITAIKSKAADGGAGGVPAYLTATEYYVDRKGHERSSSAWFGKGAEALGLVGKPVSIELMDKLARGFAPDGSPLRQNAGATPQVRPVMDRQGKQRLDDDGKPMTATVGVRVGFDLTWSAPKSVSIAFAGADPALRDKILAAHHAAVEKGLAFMEKHAAETRRGKGGKDVIGAELLVSRHTHYGSRPHEKDWKQRGDHRMEVDAQLHTHALVYNVARGDDGQWGTIEPREMYRWKMTVGALYRAELAAGLQRLGFGIEEDIRFDQDGQVKDRFFKIAGIPDDLAEEMSGRRKQILAHMEAHGGTAQQANFATRNSKDEPGFSELLDRWHADLADYRARHPGMMPDKLSDLLDRGATKVPAIDQAKLDRELLTELHETKSVWTRADLTEKIAVRNVGRLDAQGVLREASAFLIRNCLSLIDPERIHGEDEGKKLSCRHTEVRFADPKVVDQERELVRAAVARKDEQEIRLNPGVVAAAIADMEAERGFKLSAEQRGAVEFATTGSGGVALVQGWAGSGKTTAAEATVRAFRASGREVIGCSTGWDASKKLEAESGIPSHSIASLVSKLDKGRINLTEKSVILIDEAGMVGTPSLTALMKHAHSARAKIICQGDVLQLQSVERGAPMRAMAEAIGSATLKDIRRQRSVLDKDTADLYYAAGGTELRSRRQNQQAGEVIMARMEARGQLVGLDDITQAQKTLVQDYAASKLPARDKLVLASTREDVDALNRAIRDVRRTRGELGIEHVVPTTNPRSGQIQTIALAENDRIRFTKKSEELGVVNGSKAVVTGLVPHPDGSFTVRATIESDIKKGQDGRKIEFKTKDVSITHGYASTVHRAQGQSVEEVFHLGHRGMTDRQLSLVSFTRMKSSYALYGVASELFDRSGDEAHATDRLQTNALQEGLSRKFGGRTTTQVMADIAKEKSLHAAAKAVEPVAQTPKARRLAEASAAIKQASPKVKAKQRPPVQTSPEQASLVQRAATAFKTVASRMRQAVLARQREVEQQLAQQRKRTRSMSR